MRRLLLVAVLALAGCSLLFDGSDLHGTGGPDGGMDASVPGDGGGADLAGGDLGSATDLATGPLATLAFSPAPMTPTAVGAGPYGVALGDFDGDGRLDAVTANDTDNTVSVLLGAGDGHFSTVMSVAVPPGASGNTCSPYAIAAGRFNADAIDDIVVTCTDLDTANFVYFLPGAANHSYQPVEIPALTSTSVIKPEGIAVGDFDKDGNRDLVVANAGVNQIWVLSGKGDGTFASMPTKLAAGDYARSVAAGDFNGDGRDDVAAADYNDAKLTVYLQGSGGGLAAGAPYNTVGDNNGLAARDLDGDDHSDLVTADSQNDSVAVLIGSKAAAGTFPTAAGTMQPPEYSAHPTPAAVAIADFNRDGKMDLAVANAINPSGSIDVLLGNGDGTFGSAISLGSSDTPIDIQAGDFNGDGLPDLIVTNNGAAPAVTVLLNTSH